MKQVTLGRDEQTRILASQSPWQILDASEYHARNALELNPAYVEQRFRSAWKRRKLTAEKADSDTQK